MDEKNPTTDVIGALAEDVDGEVLGEGPGIASDGQSGAGSEVLEQASAEFLGRWNRLVSTTNWEKGRIISAWRKAMIDSGAPPQAYSDEAWARRVGNVSGQHVGRLRRVYDRFGGGFESFPGLFWSHFQAALDWHDAEMWLEGAVQNSWSVAQMRNQRWEATGAADGEAPPDEEIASEFDEDSQAREEIPPEKIDASRGVVRDPDADDASDQADSEHDGDDEPPFDAGPPAGPDSAGSSGGVAIRPFANLPKLPDDVRDALESFKLAILAHKLTGWDEVSCDDILAALDALKQLALAPSDR
ncbi:MAG: hypothetical protein QM844_13385 [Planctomycetota bacterium]|nr:hypothetical protein [Planctomycetota bacterium]